MRLLVLTTSYPLSERSASGAFVARLVEQLSNNLQVLVATPASRSGDSAPDVNGVVIRTFCYAPRPLQVLAHEPGGIPVALRTRKWTYLLLPVFLFSMFMSCWRHGRRSHVIHANWAICGLIAGLVGKMLGIPVVTTLRGDDVTRAQKSRLDQAILRVCLRMSARVVCVSTAIEALIRKLYPEHSNKTQVIENGVDDAFLRVSLERASNRDNALLRVITVGSLIERKNIQLLIAALQRLAEKDRVALTIIGAGPERQRLETLAHACSACHIEFKGEISPNAIPDALAQADVFVLTSRSEGRPNVILEAMAAGLPVIASNIPGVNELVDHNITGLLFTSGDADELAGHLRRLLREPHLRQQLGAAGRDAILRRQLVWRATAEKYAKLYAATVAERT